MRRTNYDTTLNIPLLISSGLLYANQEILMNSANRPLAFTFVMKELLQNAEKTSSSSPL